jgi:kynurenine 3-monooxygenase
MMLKMDRFEYEQAFLEHGYKELTIPPAAACGVDAARFDGFAMDPHALHIWPRGGSMMIALPNQDRSFTCTCFWPYAGPNGFERLTNDREIVSFFQRQFPDAVALMPTLVDDYTRNPVGSLVTIRCYPWQFKGKALIIGDAAHALVPFYGQGANCAFEDCSVLAECIKKCAPDWPKVFESFATRRKPNADAIAEMALHNFIEMRDHTASRLFRARKKLEHFLHRLFPQSFMPLYNMISFSTIPYAEALARSKKQKRTIAIGLLAVVVAILVIKAIVLRAMA